MSGPIIMVEDNELDASLAKACFEQAGVDSEFLCFESGMAFLEHLQGVRQGSVEMPSVILLDLNMPGMNGFAVLSHLKSSDDFQKEPQVTIVSHSDDPRDAARCLAMGADRYFTKPANAASYIEFFSGLVH